MTKILIAASDRFLRRMLLAFLSDLGAAVETAESEAELVMRCEYEEYELVVTMLLPPFLCGHDIIRRLRRPCSSRPRVYFLSWLHNEDLVLSLLESGVDQYMTLPVNMLRLRGKVAALLNRPADD